MTGDLAALAARANLAPSVHNTQPARWHRAGDGSLLIAADLSRRLPAGDPGLHDMGVSCGAAAEGTVLALSEHGLGGARVEDLWAQDDRATLPGHRLAARIVPAPGPPDPLAGAVAARHTWRGGFAPVPAATAQALAAWAAGAQHVTLVRDPAGIALLARLGDHAALGFLRDPAFRAELLGWMRLSRRDPRHDRDGMNARALHLSAVEALGARLFMGTGLFAALDRVGLAGALTGEAAKTRSAAAIALIHLPAEASPLAAGRVFYRRWLELAGLGLAGWPLAAVADDPGASADCARRFALPEGARLVTALRLGCAPPAPAQRARLAPPALVVGPDGA